MRTDESTLRPEHLPAPTYTPAIVGAAVVLVAWGAVTTISVVILGLLLLAVGVAGWILEIRREHRSKAYRG
jgi:Flp pilus assembly protein TadB